MPRPRRTAIIGAGIAGLAMARELRREGIEVVVFEKGDDLGGIWNYDPRPDSDPVGLDPNREVVHSSVYLSLRTNLPRQIMGLVDYPFREDVDGDRRTFPGHEEVLRFVKEFAEEFGLRGLVRFGSEVVRVERVGTGRGSEWLWLVEWKTKRSEEVLVSEEKFEAVVVCNGHYTQPRVPTITGIEKWPGYQIHSHNYRVPEPFRDKVVVIIGFAASAFDISRDVAKVAKEVHVASRSPEVMAMKVPNQDNIWQHKMVKYVTEESLVAFEDGSSIHADVMFYCTGYTYHFPFLETNGIVTIEDNRVGPLYKHVFPPSLAPSLSFIGLTEKVAFANWYLIKEKGEERTGEKRMDIIFQMTDLQCKWVARVLSGKVQLPSETEMMASVEEYYQQMEKNGYPKHTTHHLHFKEVEYCNWLAAEAGLPPVEDWKERMYVESIKSIFSMKDNYREQWDDAYWDAIIREFSLSKCRI